MKKIQQTAEERTTECIEYLNKHRSQTEKKSSHLDELKCPYGICFNDEDQIIYIADCWNHRIVEWRLTEKSCRIAAGGKGKGNRTDQLHCPIDVILDRENDSLLISDYENRRVMRWPCQKNSSGRILISDIDCAYLAMHRDGTLYITDWKRNEVRRWKTGEMYATRAIGGNGRKVPKKESLLPVEIPRNNYLSPEDYQ